MRKTFLSTLFIAISFIGYAQVKFEALTFSPPYPGQGQKLSFEFNAGKSPLSIEKKTDIAVYLFSDKGLKVIEPAIIQNGQLYSGSVQLDTNTNCIAFGFSGGEQKDNNFGKGFFIPVYNSSNKPLQNYYLSASQLYGGYGEYLFGITNDPAKGLATLEEGISAYPAAKENDQYAASYLFTLNSVKKKEAEPIILEQLKAIEKKPLLKENEYGLLTQWYTRLKRKSAADSFTALKKKQYPEGAWKKAEAMDKVLAEKDAEKMKKLLDEYTAAFPPKEEDKYMLQNVKSQLAGIYAKNKNYPAFKETANSVSAAERYSLYNNLAWELAEANENVAEAKAMAKEATEWTKKEVASPTEKKPEQLTQKAWEKKRKSDYAMYGDTYAFILYNTGEYKEGLSFAKDAATINKLQDAELNERYALLLEKAAPAEESKKIIEQMVSDGKATSKTKEALKNIYIKENKNETGFDTYLANLELAAKEKRAAEITKTMINEPAPKFILKDFSGKDVSLESLKGKVVVVDFWATWCGPCIASMPGMKKAEDKLKTRGDVTFLFIDTWEGDGNKKQNAMNFMKKKNYQFYVLMDDENKVVSDFSVSGIPTKFVIDKAGNIRFKAVGFSGNADDLVDELSLMVDLASK